jgi:CPA2 family monovalent cation:H+ antiporter-2
MRWASCAGAGQVAVGVLIAQDLAVVPMLILVSSLGGEEHRSR